MNKPSTSRAARRDRHMYSLGAGLVSSLIISSLIMMNRAFIVPVISSAKWPDWTRFTWTSFIVHVIVFWIFSYFTVRYYWNRGFKAAKGPTERKDLV